MSSFWSYVSTMCVRQNKPDNTIGTLFIFVVWAMMISMDSH